MKDKKHYFFLIAIIFFTIQINIQPAQATETELIPIQDAYINSYYPDSNYGASAYLSVGTLILGYDVTYLKFNIPLSEKVILSATVKTFWYNFMIESRMLLAVGTASNSWDENTITWNNAPYFYYQLIATRLTGDGEWFNFDVLNYIPESGLFSIILFEEGGWSGEYLQSDSRENDIASDPPVLVIVYETTIEDFIPFIIIGVLSVAGVCGGVGIAIHIKRKKKREISENLKNSTLIKDTVCPKCGKKPESSDMAFCSECGQKFK